MDHLDVKLEFKALNLFLFSVAPNLDMHDLT